jgi:hypothetical protein
MPRNGSTSRASCTTAAVAAATPGAAAMRSHWTPAESYTVANARGAWATMSTVDSTRTGTIVQT